MTSEWSISPPMMPGISLISFKDRNGTGSICLVSQIPIENWYDTIPLPTIADAIMDRLIHNSYRIEMRGESMRKKNIHLD
jgi:DNA replication protein DnaC